MRWFICLWLLLMSVSAGAQTVPPTGRSTGHVVLNLATPTMGSFAFINYIKTIGSWGAAGVDYGSLFDANGYPTSVPPSTLQTTFTTSRAHNDYVIAWDGQIGDAGRAALQVLTTVTVREGARFVVGGTEWNLSMTGTNGRVRFAFKSPPSTVALQILATANPSGFSNLRFYRAEHESLIKAGETFNPDYLKQIAEINPQVLRLLDWSPANGGITPKYKYLTPRSSLGWTNAYWYPRAWAGRISGTDTYAVGNSAESNPSAYEDGEVIQGRVTNANTSATPTLNRNGLGAKAIVNNVGNPLSPGNISANSAHTFVYNALLDKFIWRSNGLFNGVPLDVMLELCNKLNKDCWIPYPLNFDNASYASVAGRARDVLNPGLKFYTELSNEVWNFSFPQTHLADRLGQELGFPTANGERHYSYYGLRTRQIGEAAAKAWSPRSPSQLVRVSAFQAFGGTSSNDAFRFQGRDLFISRPGLTATITIASPAVVTLSGQAVQNGNSVVLSTTGSLPTGLSPSTTYYVVNANPATGRANLAATPGGAAINTSGNQSGTHTAVYTNLAYQAKVGVAHNAAPNRPIDYVDVLSYATYYHGGQFQAFDTPEGGYLAREAAKAVTGITRANPGVVTANGHGYSNGDRVFISGIGGMTQLNRTYHTVANVTANSFALQGLDTSGFETYTSGGTVQRIRPSPQVFAAADAFNAGDVAKSRAIIDADIRAGTRNGVLGGETLQALLTNIYPGWEAVRAKYGKGMATYEGGLQIIGPSTRTLTSLGVSTNYAASITNAINDYKTSDMFRRLVIDQFRQQQSITSVALPSWYYFCFGTTSQWSTHLGDLYSTKFKSYDGMADFNAGRQNFLLKRDVLPGGANDNTPMWLDQPA